MTTKLISNKNMHPLISVVIPTYNRAHLLPQAIESVAAQTYNNWELLIVDDGSGDNTKQAVKKYLSDKIRYIECSHSGFPAVVRNVGIKNAHGSWIAFLDSDDVWLPHKLEVQVQALRKFEDVGIICSNTLRETSDSGSKNLKPYFTIRSKEPGNYFLELIQNNFVITSTVLARKSQLELVRGFNESPPMVSIEDYDLWLRCTLNCKLQYLSNPLIIYRDYKHDGIRGTVSLLTYWKGMLRIYDNLKNQLSRKGEVIHPILKNEIKLTRIEILKTYMGWNSLPLMTARNWYRFVKRIFSSRGAILATPPPQLNPFKFKSNELKEYVQKNKGKVKIHLGCGERAFDGYINIDFPIGHHTAQITSPANYYHDIRTLHFPPFSIAEIRLHHVFEHFERPTALRLLINWHTWLIEGGQLIIEVPDFNRCTLRIANPFIRWQRKASSMRHLFGSHEARWAYHYEGWNKQRLKHTLKQLGFTPIKFYRSRWKGTFNITVLARKQARLSKKELEIRAIELLKESLVDGSISECRMLDVWKKKLIP